MSMKLETVDEISAFLGVKRARAYGLAREWEQSNGKSGLPCIRLGSKQLRFDRTAIVRHLEKHDNKQGENEEVGSDEEK